ncbi:MAG: ferrous iron transport protein B [Bacteroidaceae bacterium]|nr:ferrous iron transport protein B [Bacteroidaceae bacterium]
MNLSELNTGEVAYIVKVHGHGGFRKRIVEMGFVRGQKVEVLLNAPLQDPVKYRVMGYEVSLRRAEAELIEVDRTPGVQVSAGDVSVAAVTEGASEGGSVMTQWGGGVAGSHPEVSTGSQPVAEGSGGSITVALIGNPNCGKTSLFNYASGAHARVGNYSGVTVDATEATALCDGRTLLLTDLPGTYSLSCYSPEELYVRRHLAERSPDVIVNVIDASNLERNLYLTTQLVDMDLRVVCAMNMFDEFERRGDSVDIGVLEQLFGVPMVATSFKSGRGVGELLRTVVEVADDRSARSRHIHIPYGHEIEDGISHIQRYLKLDEHLSSRFSTRYLAIKLLEHDADVTRFVEEHVEGEHRSEDRRRLMAARDYASARVQEETGTDSETAIMDAKYGFIHGALTEAHHRTGTANDTYRTTHLLDSLLSHRYLGFPIFFVVLFLMFEATFVLGQYPMDWIEAGVAWLGQWVGSAMADGPLRSMLVDGVIGGVGSVIVFLPQILILYTFISFMEDSGYMARAAFIMDRLMHGMGLHGKSFIPLIMGFGCNVPAIMATRTIESRRSRLITMMVLPFMSCSARLPIYIMVVGTFFAAAYRPLVLVSLYVVGIAVAVVVSNVLARFVVRGDDTPFVMELPPYRWPTAKAVWRHTWEKGKEYLKKMGGIILVASIIVWALSYFPRPDGTAEVAPMEQSYLGRFGKAVEPIFAPQGFNWKLDVSIISGVGAKEIVASTMGVLYAGDESFGELASLDEVDTDETSRFTHLGQLMAADGITPLTAYAYLIFVLLYFPCVATVVAIKNETGSWRWAMASAVGTTVVAWVVSALVVLVGTLGAMW